MSQLEYLTDKYNILKEEDLFFSKDGLSIGFYMERGLKSIRLAKDLSDEINIIQIYYRNNHTSYFQEERELWRNDEFNLRQRTEEETIACLENIIMNVFMNYDKYRIKAENTWIVNQIKKKHFFCLGAILDTAYDPHKSSRVFNPHKRLDKDFFKIYEVVHVYDFLNKKQGWYDAYEIKYYFIKYDNNYVSDLYINQFVPALSKKTLGETLTYGVTENIEITFCEDLTKNFRKKYDKNEHYRYFLNPIAVEITNTYKEKIFNIISHDEYGIYQAVNIAWEYRKLSPTMNELVDLMFYLIETGIQLNYENSQTKETERLSINYLHDCYKKAMKIISENTLHDEFRERAERLVNYAHKIDDWMYSTYSKIFSETYPQ